MTNIFLTCALIASTLSPAAIAGDIDDVRAVVKLKYELFKANDTHGVSALSNASVKELSPEKIDSFIELCLDDLMFPQVVDQLTRDRFGEALQSSDDGWALGLETAMASIAKAPIVIKGDAASVRVKVNQYADGKLSGQIDQIEYYRKVDGKWKWDLSGWFHDGDRTETYHIGVSVDGEKSVLQPMKKQPDGLRDPRLEDPVNLQKLAVQSKMMRLETAVYKSVIDDIRSGKLKDTHSVKAALARRYDAAIAADVQKAKSGSKDQSR